jgi:hypothetical protein
MEKCSCGDGWSSGLGNERVERLNDAKSGEGEGEGMLLDAGSEDLASRECNGNTTGVYHRYDYGGMKKEGGGLASIEMRSPPEGGVEIRLGRCWRTKSLRRGWGLDVGSRT